MIGGKVIEVAAFPPEAQDSLATHRIWVVGTGCEAGDELAFNVENDRGVRFPQVGETVWRQSGRVFFGGPDPKHGEISMRLVGSSYDPRDVIKRCPA